MITTWLSSIVRCHRIIIRRTLFQFLIAICGLMSWTGPALAADTGKLVEKDGKYVFVESMDPATKLLLERAARQGTITQEEYAQVMTKAADVALNTERKPPKTDKTAKPAKAS